MKKYLFSLLVVALVVALASPVLAETTIGGSYRIRGVYWDQGLENGKLGGTTDGVGRYFDNRLRLNIDSKVTDALAVHVEADSGLGYNGRNGDFENPAATPDSYDGVWNAGGSALNAPDGDAADRDVMGHDIVFQQAYMDFATPIGAFTLGRQWSTWGMGLLLGENRNRLMWSYKAPAFAISAGLDKFMENSAFSKGDDVDNYFVGALINTPMVQFGPYFEWTHADRFTGVATPGVQNVVGGEGLNTYALSLYGNTNIGPVALSAEFAYRGGSVDVLTDTVDFNGYAGTLRAAMDLKAAKVGAEFGYVSGDEDPADDSIDAYITPWSFSPFAIIGELAINGMNLNGGASGTLAAGLGGESTYSDYLSNIIYGKLYAQMSPMPKLDLYAAIGYAVTAQDTLDTLGNTRDDEIGTEIDLSATYKITPNLAYNATFGYLFTGKFFDDGQNATTAGLATAALGTNEPENALLLVHSISMNF